ncbi:MAG: class I SAM-dependent methyltransferase [Anaerolineales bacterium]|nr:class I SAM-dependent methyltransferase [Anaerolineales bacterium]
MVAGKLISKSGREYEIRDGIPDLIFPRDLGREQKDAMDYYEGVAGIYDDVANLSFDIQYVDEEQARRQFAKRLNLTPSSRVLELACGTGRDSVNIASELDKTGQLYLQDISRSMLLQCVKKLKDVSTPVEYSTGNACYLPFPDRYFDAVYSFGGLGVFGDIRQSLREIVRVCRVGAKVVVGDESMAPWLYESEYGRMLLNNNPLFKNPLPLSEMPVEARNLSVQWVVGGVYYLIEFEVGAGEPDAKFDIRIPGKRGGTLRTRYYGRLEGVTPEAKELAQQAREVTGESMHDWLDRVVREAATGDLRKE